MSGARKKNIKLFGGEVDDGKVRAPLTEISTGPRIFRPAGSGRPRKLLSLGCASFASSKDRMTAWTALCFSGKFFFLAFGWGNNEAESWLELSKFLWLFDGLTDWGSDLDGLGRFCDQLERFETRKLVILYECYRNLSKR